MNSQLAKALAKDKKIKLMTHVVAGYPDFEINLACIKAMEKAGTDIVEVQIPFSDPMADGPTIMRASQSALDNGTTVDDCFAFLKKLTAEIEIPVLIMSYYNILYSRGPREFCARAAKAGCSGLIVPDIPFDEGEENFIQIAKENQLVPIIVVSPGLNDKRLRQIAEQAEGFLYTTLRCGTTGARKEIESASLDYLARLKQIFQLPIAAGFGISGPEHVRQIQQLADIAVVGSKMIQVMEEKGVEGVAAFTKELLS